MWSALALLPLLLGSTSAVPQTSICARTGSDIRASIANGEVDVPPEVRTLLLDITDGEQNAMAADVLRVRARSDAKVMAKWLDLALFQATYYNRAGIAEWLIGQGANVNAHPLNIAFASSSNPTEDEKIWPPIELAADCGNTAAFKVLLAHHADMYTSLHEPRFEPGTLLLAIMGRHEDAVEALLDHGYDPCLIYANYYPGPDRSTAAQLAEREHLSPGLIKRLAELALKCQIPAPASTR